jgi:HEPN domain-containing protein
MVDIEIVREWVEKAEEDFQFAVINLKEGNSFFAQICFHFQQAAEKYLKAFIVAHEVEFRKIHDLDLLRKTCQTKDSSFEELKEVCQFLATFYVETRYPVHWPTRFSLEEAQKASVATERIRSAVREKLGIP